jgi:hypothetical protein
MIAKGTSFRYDEPTRYDTPAHGGAAVAAPAGSSDATSQF